MDIVYRQISDNRKGIAEIENVRFHGEIYFIVIVGRKRITCELYEFLDSWVLKIDGRDKDIDLACLSDTFWNSEHITDVIENEVEACAIASAIYNIYKHQMDIL